MNTYRPVPPHIDLPAMEREIIDFWREHGTFEKIVLSPSGTPFRQPIAEQMTPAADLRGLAIAGASALEAVAIIPEQRFAVSLMIFMWSLSLVGLFDSARLQIGRKPTASGT